MRTLRLTLVVAASLAMLGGIGGLALAQDEPPAEPELPAEPESMMPVDAAIVTGSVVSSSTDSSELELTEDDGVMVGGGLKATSEFEWSDPRLPGEGEVTMNFVGGPGVGLAYHYMWMLEGPEGYWTGPESGFCDAGDRCRGTAMLTGHGIHEGLFAVLITGPQLDSAGEVLRDPAGNIMPVFDGAIYPGVAPAMPNPPERSTE